MPEVAEIPTRHQRLARFSFYRTKGLCRFSANTLHLDGVELYEVSSVNPEARLDRIESLLERMAERHVELDDAQLNQTVAHTRFAETVTAFVNKRRERFDDFHERMNALIQAQQDTDSNSNDSSIDKVTVTTNTLGRQLFRLGYVAAID